VALGRHSLLEMELESMRFANENLPDIVEFRKADFVKTGLK
jgi:hypothetical protein